MKMMRSLLPLSVLFLLCCAQCARYPALPELEEDATQRPRTEAEEQQLEAQLQDILGSLKATDEAKDYGIGIKDVLKIEVWQQPELTRMVEVAPDGTITLPLIGSVDALGKTVEEVDKEITQRLEGRYLVNPQVNVEVAEYKSQSVSVLGEVGGGQGGRGVGRYPLKGKTTLLEVLTEAGLSPDAGTECLVVRPKKSASTGGPTLPSDANEGEVVRIDIVELMRGDLRQNIVLRDGDTIYVPKAQHYFVYGEVEQPGSYKLEKDTTVLKAITTAGGLTERAASIKRVKILREVGGEKQRIAVQATDRVKPQDTIIVPESFF